MVLMISCLLLTGCGILKGEVVTVNPLPDTTMENLTDAILSVSLEKGDAYVDDTGKMQMDLQIYSLLYPSDVPNHKWRPDIPAFPGCCFGSEHIPSSGSYSPGSGPFPCHSATTLRCPRAPGNGRALPARRCPASISLSPWPGYRRNTLPPARN